MDGFSDCGHIISMSAMLVYGIKSHEELRWEDYQLRKGGNGAPGASPIQNSERPSSFSFKPPNSSSPFQFPPLQNTNIFLQTSEGSLPFLKSQKPSSGFLSPGLPNANINVQTTEQPSPFSLNPQKPSSSFQFPPLPNANTFLQTSERPPPFSLNPQKPSSAFQFPPLPNANIDVHATEQPSLFSLNPQKPSSSFLFPPLPNANINVHATEQPSPFFLNPQKPLSSFQFPLLPNANINEQAIEQPSPLFLNPQKSSSSFQFPPLPNANINVQTTEQPSPFFSNPQKPSSSFQFPTKTYTCTACGFIEKDATTSQFQSTVDSRQTESPEPADNVVPVKDPFGVQSSKSQLSADHATPATSTQIGISRMPVVDKPAPSRISFLSTPRHFSQWQPALRSKTSPPKSDVKKVPFFIQMDPHGLPRPINHPIPRENPKSAFMMNVAEPLNETLIEKTLPLKANDDDDKGNICDQLEKDLLAALPKMTRSDYYTEPLISELEAKESMDPGFCGRVRGFVIGRLGYGKIEFEGETGVRGLDLDSLVELNTREVAVYKDDTNKPPVGEGLNRPALVTLLTECKDKKTGEVFVNGYMVARYVQMLKRAAEVQGAEFVSYDPIKGEWKFRVPHF